MKKILLISFFASTNIGDNAICEVLKDQLSRVSDLTTMDISGKQITRASVSKADDSTQIAPKCKFYNLKSFLSLRRPARFEYANELIQKSDLILIAGGNMIMDLEKFAYYSFLCDHYTRYAKKLNKKIAFAFVGVGRIQTDLQKKRWKRTLMRSDLIAVRDTLARETIIRSLKFKGEVSVWRDPVFLLNDKKTAHSHGNIGINIYADAVSDPEKRKKLWDTYVFLIEELQKDAHVILYTTEKRDAQGAHKIYDMLRTLDNAEVFCPSTIQELLELYGKIDVAVATRMHAFIIATTQNIPSLILSWDKKINGLVSDLKMPENAYDIGLAYESKDEILDKARQMLANNEQYSRELKQLNSEIKQEFDEYIAKIAELTEE